MGVFRSVGDDLGPPDHKVFLFMLLLHVRVVMECLSKAHRSSVFAMTTGTKGAFGIRTKQKKDLVTDQDRGQGKKVAIKTERKHDTSVR